MAPLGVIGSAAPIILAAALGAEEFAWLDGLRRQHFPAERNQLSAHLTLFHALPPSIADELDRRLVALTRGAPPAARASGLVSLGRGVAVRIASPDLDRIRRELAEAFADCLTPQDANGFRAHVTIQNKVSAEQARALLAALEPGFRPQPIRITGLASYWYRDGPWELRALHRFRGRPG